MKTSKFTLIFNDENIIAVNKISGISVGPDRWDESSERLDKITEKEFKAADGLARVINGSIYLGETPEEKAEIVRQDKIVKYTTQLEQIDQESGASRPVRDVSVSAGVALDAYRVLMLRLAEQQGLSLPEGFGAECTTASEMLALIPPANATNEEKEDFAVHKALLLVSHYDPAINPGLQTIKEAEMKAAPIRDQLAPLFK